MTIQKIQVTSQHEHLQHLQEHIIRGWAEQGRSNTTGHENILDILRLHGSD